MMQGAVGIMKKSIKIKKSYDAIIFDDPDDYAPDTSICSYCGSESDDRIGYNEKEDLLKRACSNCGVVYIEDADGEIAITEGEVREWSDYLEKNLVLPFEAEVIADESAPFNPYYKSGPIVEGDKLSVIGFEFEDDLRGIIVAVKKGRKKYGYQLCDLKTVDETSTNSKLLDDYSMWFANCR